MPDGYITLTDETTVLLSPDPVITFDDIGPIENGDGWSFLPTNDLWQITSGTRYFDKTIVDNEEGGWITASGDYAAIVAAEVGIGRKDVLFSLPFDFKSVSLTALNRIDLRIDITARDDEGVTLATDTLMVSQGSYTDYVADPALFDDIATLEFRSSGGTPADPELGDTSAFLMDDLLLV